MGENKFADLFLQVGKLKKVEEFDSLIGKIYRAFLADEITCGQLDTLIESCLHYGEAAGVLEVAACGK